MESNLSKCKKFSANIFDKSKCQNCFRPKEQHTTEALESSKVLRKVSKCGYLFVAPESFDFTNPMDKTRRWQRRFFVLYDDGELTYSLDENVGTIPQGVVDMNKCTDVHDAESPTSHPLSIAVRTQDKTTYIKGNDKHVIERWFDVLVMYPRSLKTKHRRSPTYPSNIRQSSSFSIATPTQDSSLGATPTRASPRSISAPSCAKASGDPPRSTPRAGLDVYGSHDSTTPTYIVNGRTKNETDEYKMAKSGELAARMGHHLATDVTTKQRPDPYDDLMYMKKGWLLKQHQDQDWSKHWFVLSGSSLSFYKDSRAEETSDPDGCIDIASCYEIRDTNVSRNYGFKLKTSQGDHILSAMTSGIRNNWIQAIEKCMETNEASVPQMEFNPANRDYNSTHDYSPASSTHTSTFSSPRSSSRHSEYTNSQCDVTPRRPTVTSTPAPHAMFAGDGAASASPRGDHSEAAWSRPSRARRALEESAFSAGGGEGPKAAPSAAARFVSCTWPYDSSSSGASGSEREHTPDSSSHGSRSRCNSNVSLYLGDDDETRSQERTAEEEQALDDVEHNIRRIHRRSLSDHSSRQKPTHFEKFESGSAFESNDQAGSGRSSSATTPTHRHQASEHSIPSRAPSAKLKEKSRARSPRPRSPPPLEVKAREVRLDNTVPLRQVESLKNQLERTRTELTDSKHENHTIKLQLLSNTRDQDDLITDLESDKTRYLTQIEDIQDQMEHTTGFLQQRLVDQEAKLVDQQNHADLTKLQVQTLKKQLKEAKDKMEAHESQLKVVQSKLKSDIGEQALQEAIRQKEQLEFTCKELEKKMKLIEDEVKELELQLEQQSQELNERDEQLENIQDVLEHSERHILDLEHDLKEMHTVQAQLKSRDDKIADLEEELSAARSQLNEQDQELAMKDDLHDAERQRLQENVDLDRRKLEDHLKELEKQLEVARRQSTMSDSLNSNMADILREKDETIAQLEEKLIENDSKIEELTEEVALEMEENTQLQLHLEASYGETARGKHELEKVNLEILRLETALDDAREEANELRRVGEKQLEMIEIAQQEQLTVKERIDALQRENSELRHVLKEFKEAQGESQQLAELARELEENKCQNDVFKEECAKLEHEIGIANGKLTQYENELSILKREHEENLEQRYLELVEARQMTSELQSQLVLAEESVTENKQLLEENMAIVQQFGSPATDKQNSYQNLEEDYEDLKTKHERSMQEVRRLRNELREAHISIDDMEIAATGVKQQVKAMENDHQQQLVLMSTRIQDLTTKLATADKKVRKLERRASRRESKLKLRRDSLELGEKTSGSSGEAEHERESDVQVPDPEVLEMLKAVVTPVQVETVESSLNTSLGNSSYNMDNSINIVQCEVDLRQGDNQLATKCKQLEDGLIASDAKVEELRKALDLTTPDGQNRELHLVQEQNKKYEEQIIFLTAKLNKSSAAASVEAAKAKRAANKDDNGAIGTKVQTSAHGGIESKLGNTKFTLQEMQHKLVEVVNELGSMSIKPTTRDYTSTISSLRTRLETILIEIGGSEDEVKVAPKRLSEIVPVQNLKIDDPMLIFADKLSLEAKLVDEIAHIIRNEQEPVMSEQHVYLHEIAEANYRILELEQKVESLQYDGTIKMEQDGMHVMGDPLTRCSGLLAEKMILQSQMDALLVTYKNQMSIKDTIDTLSTEGTRNLGKDALLKNQSCKRLQSEPHASLTSRVLVHGEFNLIMNKLRERMTDTRTDQERIELLDHELEISHQRLCERANLMCDGVEAYKMAALDKVAATIVNNKVSKEGIDTQMASMIQKSAAAYRRLSVDSEGLGIINESILKSRRHEMIMASIHQEVEEAVEVLAERCVNATAGKSTGGEAELNAVLQCVCEVLAQKAVIDGHIAYITEQIQQHQQQGPADVRHINPLRRHDSGIIVGGNSMPTSPMADEISPTSSTDGDVTSLAGRLAREACAKRQLALKLRERDGTSESVQTQMAKIAADLVNVDIDLVRHRQLISDYTDIITPEAMFQAQITYITEQLQMQHEQQITELHRQLDIRSPGMGEADEKQIQALETEIQRLSELLKYNEALLKKETANTTERMLQLEAELQNQEDFFQTEVAKIEKRYSERLKVTEHELQDTQDDLEKLQSSTQEERKTYAMKIKELEYELEEARTKLATKDSLKTNSNKGLRDKVSHLEKKLEEVNNAMLTADHKHHEQLEVYTNKLAKLEAQIIKMSEKHTEQLATAQKDKMAAVEAAGAAALQDEVTFLRARIDEQHAEHEQQMETLKQPSGGEDSLKAEALAQGTLNAKIHQLEWQMENMQGDYERELTVQRLAHRRELTRSKEDLLGLLAEAEAKSMQIDEHTIRKRYTKEIEHIKEIYDCGFAAMEKSHQRVLREMRAAHQKDLEILRGEKDQLLIEETKATQAALDAMRKAHEAEVQKERNKFLDAISKTYSNNDVDSIQRQHQEDLDLIQNEIRQLSEKLSIKCLENAALDERLQVQTAALAETRSRAHELMARNEELSLRMRQDIERLSKMIKQPAAPGGPFRRQGDPPEMYDLKELEDSMERYQELHSKQEDMRTKYEAQLQELRRHIDTVMEEPGDAVDEIAEEGNGGDEASAQHERGIARSAMMQSNDQSPRSVGPRQFASTAHTVPQVSTETRNVKRFLWRQRHVQRSRSTPGPPAMIRRLSLPVQHDQTPAPLKEEADVHYPVDAPERRNRKERSSRHTTVGINVAQQIFTEKL